MFGADFLQDSVNIRKLWKRLRPVGDGTLEKEEIDGYLRRVVQLLPNWPVSAIEQLFYRHYAQVQELLNVDDPRLIQFDEIIRSTAEVGTRIQDDDEDWLNSIGTHITSWPELRRGYLMNYMLEKGTWPTSIIVSTRDEYDFDLFEGHKRLAYLRQLHRAKHERLRPTHSVLVIHGVGGPAKQPRESGT